MALLSYGLPCATGARLSWSIPFPAPIVSDYFIVRKDTDSAQQPGDTFFQRDSVGRKPDMNGKRATFEKIRILDLPDVIRNSLLTGQVPIHMHIPNIHQGLIRSKILPVVIHKLFPSFIYGQHRAYRSTPDASRRM